jgi:hypothetical protein
MQNSNKQKYNKFKQMNKQTLIDDRSIILTLNLEIWIIIWIKNFKIWFKKKKMRWRWWPYCYKSEKKSDSRTPCHSTMNIHPFMYRDLKKSELQQPDYDTILK